MLLRSDAGGVCTLTLNRPQARNALSAALTSALQAELDLIAGDDSVRVVVLSGAGTSFCAGHDMRELRANPTEENYTKTFRACSDLMLSILRLPQPVVARVDGVATAAGCQLVATCDLAVASEIAQFATPGVQIGLFCSTPMVALSRNVTRKHAMEMLLTGDMIDAATAERIGLVNRVVPATELDAATYAIAEKIASKSPLTLAIGKEAFYRQLEMDLDAAYRYTSEVMIKNLAARDAEEGIDAFIEKRDPVWEGR